MLICERCKKPIKELKEDFEGQPIDKATPWEQYLCEKCYEQIWNNLMDDCCPICRTEPCKRGRDCWINPWPHIMYLCYVAPRVETIHPKQEKLATPIPPNTKDVGYPWRNFMK